MFSRNLTQKTVVNEEKKIAALIDFIDAMEVREDDKEFQNPVDIVFENLGKKNPKHFAVRQYKKYKLAAGDATMGEQSNQLHIGSPENCRYVTA